LKAYRAIVYPVVTGVSKLYKAADLSELDEEEREGGITAFAAWMYQYGAQVDANVLVLLWIASTAVPRGIEFMEQRKAKLAARRAAYGDRPERNVSGEVVSISKEG